MVDSAIAIFLGVMLIEMARFGGAVSTKPPQDAGTTRQYTLRFRIYAAIAIVLVIVQGVRLYQAAKDAENTQTTLRKSIATLTEEFQKSDTGRQVDNAYLKAKLEDAYKVNEELRQLAPALMRVAQTGADYAKRQYEHKALGDKQLLELTQTVVTKIRALQDQYRREDRKVTDSYAEFRFKPNSNKEEMAQQAAVNMSQYMQRYNQVRLDYENAFRTTVMGDAAYCRRELLSRIGGDSYLRPGEKIKSLAIDGIMAGPDPIGSAADYLEALSRELAH